MIIYQRIFFGGDLMVFGGGGIEGVGRRQQSIRRVLWNIYCRLTTNEGGGGWGKGGIRILQSFIGGNTYFISIQTTAYQRHKSCEFSFDSNKET